MGAYDLANAASKVKEAPARMYFTYYMGEKSSQVYIASRPAGDKEKKDFKDECGAFKMTFKGVCFKEGENLILSTKEAPTSTRQTAIDKVFALKKAGRFQPILRQRGANEPDDADSEATDAPAAPAAPTDDEPLDEEGEYRKTKAEVAPKLSAAIKANPDNKQELLDKLGEALQKEKAGEYGNARAIFFQLMASMSPESDGTPPPPPKTPPPKAPPGGRAMSANELSVALKNIGPRLRRAATANPARQSDLLRMESRIREALNTGRLVEAQSVLMEVLGLVKTLTPPADPAKEAAFTASWDQATQAWFDCVGVVDGQIEKVRTAMRDSGDPDFENIAEFGLAALTGNHKTPVLAAVREVSSTSGEDRLNAVAKAREVIGGFRDYILADECVTACDEECEAEFGVRLTIRDEITRGLSMLEDALNRAPGV